jgi:hypothetical protein
MVESLSPRARYRKCRKGKREKGRKGKSGKKREPFFFGKGTSDNRIERLSEKSPLSLWERGRG